MTFILFAPVALLVVAGIRAFSLVKVVRFGPLRSERLGHLAANTELYLCAREVGLEKSNTFDLFYLKTPVANTQLAKMWGRQLHLLPVRPASLWRAVDLINRRVPGGATHLTPVDSSNARDIHGLLARTKPHLSFTAAEEAAGQAALRELGVPEGAPFVCFHARDPSYLKQAHPDRDWAYHDFRDCDINNYLPAVEALAERGYWAIRMGAVVEKALDIENQKIIDYAAQGRRTDFLDIYLGAKCRFFICSDAGIYAVPAVFRRPIVFVNFPALEPLHSWHPEYITIPKKFRSRREDRWLTFPEILNSPVGRFGQSEQHEALEIDVVENTPEEITAVSLEMDDRLNGRWRSAREDEELQRRFWSLFKPGGLHGREFVARVGADFLQRNRDLLGDGPD